MADDAQTGTPEADAAHAAACRELERAVAIGGSLDAARRAVDSMRADAGPQARAQLDELDRIVSTARGDLADLAVALRGALDGLHAAARDPAKVRGHRY